MIIRSLSVSSQNNRCYWHEKSVMKTKLIQVSPPEVCAVLRKRKFKVFTNYYESLKYILVQNTYSSYLVSSFVVENT
jgi:hypothetical protein